MSNSRPRLFAAVLSAVLVLGLLATRPWQSNCDPDQATSFDAAEVEGPMLTITYGGGVPSSDGCDSCAEIEVVESATEVVVALRVGEESGECNDMGQLAQMTISLGDALGDRLLRDDFNGEVVDVSASDD
ncbi:MAG: hypothetical protein ACI9C1_000881 [Candidatus Aldehydirespiratoraceae bacterium]